MDDEDFLDLIEVLEREFSEAGAEELADERLYTVPDVETGERRLLEPRKRLYEMLRAFERKLAIEDRATFNDAMGRLAENLDGRGPDRVTYEIAEDDDRESLSVDLSRAAPLGELRDRIARLAQIIATIEPLPGELL